MIMFLNSYLHMSKHGMLTQAFFFTPTFSLPHEKTHVNIDIRGETKKVYEGPSR